MKLRTRINEYFRIFAQKASDSAGSPGMFMMAFLIVVIWAAVGPFFHFSEIWQLIINTSTTIITFLMVFLVQSTQNRDAKAIHLKLDELIHAQKRAHNQLMGVEKQSEGQLQKKEKVVEKEKQPRKKQKRGGK